MYEYCDTSLGHFLSSLYELGFPTGRDFLVSRDKGTEVFLLSRDKGTTGQMSLHCPGTKGQRDKLKILPWDGTGRGTGQSLFFCQNPGQDGRQDGTGQSLFFPYDFLF